MNKKLLFKELRENRWISIIFISVLGVLVSQYPFYYKASFSYFIAQNVTYDWLVWGDWFSKGLVQITIVAAALLGGATLAKEGKNDTLGFLLTKPFPRKSILLTKFTSGIILIECMIAVTTIVLFIVSTVAGVETKDHILYISGFVADTIIVFPVYTFSILLSVLFMNSLKAGGTAAAVTFLIYGPVWLGKKFSPVYIMMKLNENTPGINIVPAIILVISGVVFYTMAARIFNKREV